MIKNYIKVAFRNMMRRKGFSFINILGLATGMAVCLLIVLFISDEINYDKHHNNAERIHRVVLERIYPGRSTSYSIIPQSLGESIQKEFPEVQESTRVFNFGAGNGNFFMRVDDKVYEEQHVLAVDSNFFNVFTGDFITGNPAKALMPHSAVLSESMAIKMYGSAEQAMNKKFVTDGDQNNTFMITGVCKDWPGNSHFTFNVLLAVSGYPFIRQPNYTGFSAHTYLLLKPNASAEAVERKLPVIVEKYVSGEIEKSFGQSYKDFKAAGNGYNYYLQPLNNIHLTSDLEGELSVNGSMTSIYIFGVIAIFILFLACINFINLSTARSVERAKEVGIRKTFGSEKKALIFQFLVESVLISFIALIVAFGLILLLLPLFNQLSGKSLSLITFLTPVHLLLMILLAVLVGIIAGLYPALVLSSFKPILVLKGRFKSNKSGLLLRNGLVVFQFAISVILIISAIIVNQQMSFMTSGDLGFRKDHIVIVERADLLGEQTEAFKTEISRIPGVEQVSGTSSLPGTNNFFGITINQVNSKESMTGRGVIVDENFAKTLDLQLVQGRFFSKAFGTDSLSIVLNEKAVSELGLKNPLGAQLFSPGNLLNAPDGSPYTYTVVGIIKDFHFQSLHQKISPLILINSAKFANNANVLAIRVKANNFHSALTNIENKWKSFVQDRPFHYNFLDKNLEAQYLAELRIQKIFATFSSLAIFIACIGLLGLVAYTTTQRTREISIRKVLGASTGSIVNMLSKDFLKLVAIASLVSFPLAWWGMNKWLEDFAYRIEIDLLVFVVAGIAAVLVALITISFQSLKAALSNPVKNLRTE
ncbi:MAG TPA: ABC transporter permease [Flavisolibacter sp.]|nr:ABC transporter permease [Flavisolibacter sp.]